MTGGARGIQSIEISGRILKALVRKCEPMMLKELAQEADLTPAQCHAYLTSLRNVGLVQQGTDTGLYRMGPFAMRLGIAWLHNIELPATAMRSLKALTDELGFMSLIAVWGQFGPTIVHVNAGVWPSALNVRQGTLFSLTGTATGRIFAAFGTADDLYGRIERELERSEPSRSLGAVVAREEFTQQVATARLKGFAIAECRPIPDMNAVSAPIFDAQGHLFSVATLLGPSRIMPVEENAPAVQRLLAVTRALHNEASPQPTVNGEVK
ncbi:helix-turn-helix domain-containing protein [uncultured Roseibium sp.]|uniref:IclR family transcriptional regulator n=1 Tax=uncultured Roseibium sp. TaxID=1936171 RepID=UPI0032177798